MSGAVLIAGGGTGGHVFPALAVAEALQRLAPELAVEFVGTERGLESRLVPEAGFRLHLVDARPLARTLSVQTLRLPLVVLRAAGEARRLLASRNATAALVFGGYTAVPLALAARLLRLPLVVHEQNAVPGIANRLAARFATAVAVAFPAAVDGFSRGANAVVTGNPVRPALARVDRVALRDEALAAFGLHPDRRTLLAFGGSQGAARINDALVAAAGRWSSPGTLQILHAAGRTSFDGVQAAWDAARREAPDLLVRCVPFLERMDLAYAAADLVVSRAGASTLAELTLLGVPSVLVPYPHATADHQAANARSVAAADAAVVVPDAELDAARLVSVADPLLLDAGRLAAMAARARSLGRPDAADAVARLVVEAATRQPGGTGRRRTRRTAAAEGRTSRGGERPSGRVAP